MKPIVMMTCLLRKRAFHFRYSDIRPNQNRHSYHRLAIFLELINSIYNEIYIESQVRV